MQTAVQETIDFPFTISVPRQSAEIELKLAVQNFKRVLVRADREALKNDDVVPDQLVADVEAAFKICTERLNDFGQQIDSEADEFSTQIQSELLPYLLLTNTAERWYSKPRGYAGDFLSIHEIYENQPKGRGRIGSVLDQCFLNLPAAIAVRNRRDLLAEELHKIIEGNRREQTRVTSLACGPAAEVFDVYSDLPDRARLFTTLVDIDLRALSFVADRRNSLRLQGQMKLVPANLAYLALGRETLELNNQNLVYSIGLIDYFNDRFVINLLNYIHSTLVEGGKVILGNFHPSNPNKALMDHVLD